MWREEGGVCDVEWAGYKHRQDGKRLGGEGGS